MKNHKLILLIALFLFSGERLQAQIKILKSGRVAIGSNNIDSIYKSEINGSNYCALSLTNNHVQDYQWSMISHVNKSLSKCYIVGLDNAHTFYVLGKGQIYCKEGIISDNLIVANNGIDVKGNVNITGDLFVKKSITSNGTISSSTRIVQPNIFSRFAAWIMSDSSKKTNFNPITNSIDKIMQLNGYTYNYKFDSLNKNLDTSLNGRYYGFKAQELMNIIPEVVSKPSFDSIYYVNYGHMTALIIEGIKELKNNNDSLSTIISNLTTQLNNQLILNQNLQNQMQLIQNRLDICCPPQVQENPPSVPSNQFNNSDHLDMKIQPNPFPGETTINILGNTLQKNIKILICDLNGKILKSEKIKPGNSNIQLNISELSIGVYNCILIVENKIIKTEKLIYEK